MRLLGGLSQTYGDLWSWDGQRLEIFNPCTNQSRASCYYPAQKATLDGAIACLKDRPSEGYSSEPSATRKWSLADGVHSMADGSSGAVAKALSGTKAVWSLAASRRLQWVVGSKEYPALSTPACP